MAHIGKFCSALIRFFVGAGAIVCFSCTEVSGQDPPEHLSIGVCAHLSSARTPAVDTALDLAQKLGAKVIRWDAPWRSVELQPLQFAVPTDPPWDYIVDHGNSLGIDTLMILDYGNPLYNGGNKPVAPADVAAFVRYAEFMVTHFHLRVKYFEIWNEWDTANGGGGAGTPEDYVNLVAHVFPALKAIAPESTILVGGTSREALTGLTSESHLGDKSAYHFFERTIDAGLLRYGDGLSVHPYTHWDKTTEEKARAYDDLLHAIDAYVHKNNGGHSVPLYVTEVGWPTSKAPPVVSVSQKDQAYLMSNTIEMTASFPAVKMLTIYDLLDQVYRPEKAAWNYGLIDGNGAPKLAYYQVQQAIRKLAPK